MTIFLYEVTNPNFSVALRIWEKSKNDGSFIH
jgi:hypothetical protein